MTQDDDTPTRGGSLSEAWDEHGYRLLAGGALSLVAVATVMYRILEDWSWVDSLYFSVVAISTVGFGDLTPTTDATKLFTVAYIVAGVSIFAVFLRETAVRRANRRRRRRQAKLDKEER